MGPRYVLHGLFEETAARLPSRPAVEWKDSTLSYAEADRCAAALAGWLNRHDAGRGAIVGLMLDRSLEMVVAIIGALKAGAAYLPLLPTWPLQQRLCILEEAGCRHLVLQQAFRSDFRGFPGTKLEFDDCQAFAENGGGGGPPAGGEVGVRAEPGDLAYVIFTSGSTGRPKGVLMHHGGTAMNIALNAHLSCREGERCCFSNKYTFDVHVADIFKPLCVGATVVVTRDIFRISPVDVLSTLPNKIAMAKVPAALKVIVFTGEGVTEACIRPIPRTTRVINIFGATEFFDATAKVIDWATFPERIQSIGKPLGDYVKLWVMDPETMELNPCGSPGELVVGGHQVARGYINRPEVTASKFFEPPWLPGERVYRTGDLVRRCEDGEFEYLGRAVRRLEVRGHRIDLSTVEESLASVDGITCAAVILKADEGETPQLIAFVSPRSAKPLAEAAGRALAAHMVPDKVVGVDEWPRTSSGKIDRNSLHQVSSDGVLPDSLRPSAKPRRLQRIFRDSPPPGEGGPASGRAAADGEHGEDSDEDSSSQRGGDPDRPDVAAAASCDLAACRRCAELAAAACGASPPSSPSAPSRLPALAAAARVEAYRLGVVFFNKPLPAPAEVAPMTLLPSPVPQRQMEELRHLAPVFNRLMDRVSCDVRWLLERLAPLRSVDPWMSRLLDVAEAVYGDRGAGKDPRSETRLLLSRQDYLPHSDGRYLQVEINTIAVAFAGITEQLGKIHARMLRTHCPELTPEHGRPLADNAPGTDYARALAAAHEAYLAAGVQRRDATPAGRAAGPASSSGPCVCFFCFGADHLEMDQRHTEAALQDLGVPTFRALLGARMELRGGDAARGGAGGALHVEGVEASVVYFHCTYCPEHFSSETDWENRRTIELSRAVKAPSLLAHLAGCKKVQEILSNPQELRRFLSEDEAARCAAVFAQQLDPAHPDSAAAVADALAEPSRWVLKPQREGGGNNFYGEELVARLKAREGLEQYVLMAKIRSEPAPSIVLRGGSEEGPCVASAVGEVGIFAAHLARGSEEVLSTVGGAMLRTKSASSEEGGVCAGFGVIDTPFLVPPDPHADLQEAPSSVAAPPADVCILLLCGLPGCGKSTFCGALLAKTRDNPALLGEPGIEWHHICYDQVEAECRLASAGSADAFDAAMWREARARVAELVRRRIEGRTAPRMVLILDDNMYYRSMRKQWLHFAQQNHCAFRQVFLQASAQTCLDRNSKRPAAGQVPDFSIRHMAEAFEWPCVEGRTWEALPLLSTVVDSDKADTEEQVASLLARFAPPPPRASAAADAAAADAAAPRSSALFEALPAVTDEESSAPQKQSAAHAFDLALRKVISRALAEAPKELAKAKSVLAKQWGARKAALVGQLNAQLAADSSCSAADLGHEMEEGFLRSCVADVRRLISEKQQPPAARAAQRAPARSGDAKAGETNGEAKPLVPLLGPPYRWLQIDCKCYFVENLYVKSVDAYFTLPRLDATEAEFWAANEGGGERPSAPEREKILQEAREEAARRARIPDVYAGNAAKIRDAYRPRFPELFPPHGALQSPSPSSASGAPPAVAPGLQAAEVFTPEFLELWRCARSGEGLPAALKHVHDGCFESPLLTTAFCMRLKEELRHFKAQDLPHQRPNSMNRNGCILNEIGLGPLMDRIIMTYLLPVCLKLYPEYLERGLDAHHSFIVDYGVGKDTSLGVHDDNSEVTVNVALSEDYSGGTLALYHRARVAHPQRVEKRPYHHRVGLGTMLLHPGELLHEVLPLTAGERQGLIVWLRSDAYRREHGCALCRRTDGLMYGGP